MTLFTRVAAAGLPAALALIALTSQAAVWPFTKENTSKWREQAKKATTDYVKKRTTDAVEEKLKAQMETALEKLKEKAKEKPELLRSGYVKALEDVVSNRDKIREIAEGLASSDGDKVQAAKESMAKEFATRVLDHADKDSLGGKVLGGMLENLDKIKETSEVLGSAAAGDPRPALEMAGSAIITITPIGGAVEFYKNAYGTMKTYHDKFVNHEMEEMFKLYKKALAEGSATGAEDWIRDVMTTRVGRFVMDARKIEMRNKNCDELGWAKHNTPNKLWKRLTDVSDEQLFDNVINTFKARVAKEKLDAENKKKKAAAEAEADILIYILTKAYESKYGKEWEKKRPLNAHQMSQFLAEVHKLARELGIHPNRAAELLSRKLVYGRHSKEYLDAAGKAWKSRRLMEDWLTDRMAMVMTSHGAEIKRAKVAGQPGVVSTTGTLMSQAGAWEKRGVDDGASAVEEAGPFAVAAGGSMDIEIKYNPPIGVRYTLRNSNTGVVVLYSPKLRNGYGKYQRIERVGAQGEAKEASAKVGWPSAGRFKFLFTPCYGQGPFLGRQFKQAYTAKATITGFSPSNDAIAGGEILDGDTVSVGAKGRAVLMLPNGGRLKLGPNTTARFTRKSGGEMEVFISAAEGKRVHARYARPKKGDYPAHRHDVTFRVRDRVYNYKGTEAVFEIDGEQSSVAVIEGLVEVEHDGRKTLVGAGKKLDSADVLSDYDLSTDDGGEVDGIPLRDMLLDDADDEPFGDLVANFDNDTVSDGWIWEDPKRDCTLATPERGTLVATVPTGNTFYRADVKGPRLLHKVSGDFDLTAAMRLDCEGGHWSRAQFIIRSPASFLGSEAKQFEKHTEGAHYRLMGVCWRRESTHNKLEGYRFSWREMPDAPPTGPVWVWLSRRGDVWRTSWSLDRKTWTLANREYVPAPETLWTGWSVERSSYRDGKPDAPAVCTLKEVTLSSSGRDTLPVSGWDIPPKEGSVEIVGDSVQLSLDGTKLGKAITFRQRRLSGDFDVRATFKTEPWRFEESQARYLRLLVQSDDGGREVYIGQYQLSYQKRRSYKTDVIVDRSDRIGLREEYTDDTEGALRITRKDGVFNTYYLDSGTWVPASTRFPKGFDDDVFVGFEIDNTYGGKVPVAMDVNFGLESISDDVATEAPMPLGVEELQNIVWQMRGDDAAISKGFRLLDRGEIEMHPEREWIHNVESWGIVRGNLVFHHPKGGVNFRATAFAKREGRWVIRLQSVRISRDTYVLTELYRDAEPTLVITEQGFPELRQWATEVKASTEYGTETYSASQAVGLPDCFSNSHGSKGWSPKTKEAGTEWLELSYAKPVIPTRITVREACGPGFVTKIEAANTSGEWVSLWEGEDPTTEKTLLFAPPLENNDFPTQRLRITMLKKEGEWIEVDAVELAGRPAP